MDPDRCGCTGCVCRGLCHAGAARHGRYAAGRRKQHAGVGRPNAAGCCIESFSRPRTDSEQEEPKTVELQVQQEDGTTDTVTATVYTGNGYTLAIPEGWERDDNEPQWNPHANDAVEFTVRYYDGKKADAVAELFRKDEDDYTFEAPQTGALAHV